jgi:hypothetical protein
MRENSHETSEPERTPERTRERTGRVRGYGGMAIAEGEAFARRGRERTGDGA